MAPLVLTMKPPRIPFQELVHIQKNPQFPHIYDVEMKDIARLQLYDSVECHIVLYPYSRQVSSDHITFFPFEEYAKDVSSHQRSVYVQIERRFNETFGLLLGLAIALIFWMFKPADLLSVESIVSIFGAYTIGKELWDDIERWLIGLSGQWKLRYRDTYYQYELARHTTLTLYSCFARQQRHGKPSLLPERMDFIKQSNSQTVRLFFDRRSLQLFTEPSAHLFSIHIAPSLLHEFEESGFLFGIKMSLGQKLLGITRDIDLFQSISQGTPGCIGEKGEWVTDAIFYRHVWALGRLRYAADQAMSLS